MDSVTEHHKDEYLQRVFRVKDARGVKWEELERMLWIRAKKHTLIDLGLLEDSWIAPEVFRKGCFRRGFCVTAYGRQIGIRTQKSSEWVSLYVYRTEEEFRTQEQQREQQNKSPKTPEEWKGKLVSVVDLYTRIVFNIIGDGAPRYHLVEEDYRAIVERGEHLKAASGTRALLLRARDRY